ncbi:MAG: hypothetical protein ACXVPQ_03430 [Bacteroidia bacterium]
MTIVAKSQLGINVGVSALKFNGDVGRHDNTNFFYDARLGYNLGVDYRIGKVFDISLSGIYGQLQGTDNTSASHLNFLSTVAGGELNVSAFFDKKHDTLKPIAPFISVGIGYLTFNPKGDLKDANGNTYNYWSDGSVRNVPQTTASDPNSAIIHRDYKYETTLKDSAVNYKRSCLYIPISLGTKIQMGYRANVRVAVNYNFAFTDYLDNYKKGGNDSWIGANVTLNVMLGKKPKDPYSDVDFDAVDKGDYDHDGVPDDRDKCYGTPKGVEVDSKGCPLDSDDDGVPNYLDNEANTKKGAKVDGYGVTIDEEELGRLQLQLDELFNGTNN